jgi:hypothetical protein
MCPLKQLSLSCFISPWFGEDPFDWDGCLRHQRVNRPRRTQRPQRRCQQRPSKQKGWRHESYRQCNMKTFRRISKLRWRLRGRGRTVQCLCGLSFLVIQKPNKRCSNDFGDLAKTYKKSIPWPLGLGLDGEIFSSALILPTTRTMVYESPTTWIRIFERPMTFHMGFINDHLRMKWLTKLWSKHGGYR